MITSVIFDLDGLLADTERLHYQSYQEALLQHGIKITDAQYTEHWIRAGKGIVDWTQEKGVPLDIPAVRRQKAKRYLELVESSARPMEGALSLLERLSGRKKLALASASHQDSVDCVLRCLGITRYFDVIVSGNNVPRSKPFPDIFLYTAQQLGVEPSECVVLEDAEKGVLAARQAGMQCIAVPNGYTRHNDFSQATKVVFSLNEVTLELLNTVI